MINVTKTFLPPYEEYEKYLAGIWKRNWVTNHGPLVNELELKLKEYLDIDHLLFLSNGTLAIQIAIKALDLSGEIITTPFSYVATTSCIVWEGCKPVFVDIDPLTFNIDVNKIERAITSKTTAILATHVYGNPCDISVIEKIASKYNLKVIYDAAHCFGTKYKGKSVFEYGDISTTSFHATKIFHTVEGGAVITKSAELIKKMSYLRNFGHNGPDKFDGCGINAKNSEVHAAMGLCNLNYVNQILESRKTQSFQYDSALSKLKIQKLKIQSDSHFNFAYYPILFDDEETLMKSIKALNDNLIYPRRYFYPSLNMLNYVEKSTMENSESIAKRILCLPLYFDLTKEDIDLIAGILISIQKS